MVIYTPAASPLMKEQRYPLDRRLGGPHCQFGCGGRKKKSLVVLRIKPQLWSCTSVTILTYLIQVMTTYTEMYIKTG
jgi:hypothetical protein